MEKFVSYAKKSKKEQKIVNNQKRGSWGNCKVFTTVIPNKKKYNRNIDKALLRRGC